MLAEVEELGNEISQIEAALEESVRSGLWHDLSLISDKVLLTIKTLRMTGSGTIEVDEVAESYMAKRRSWANFMTLRADKVHRYQALERETPQGLDENIDLETHQRYEA